jgi:hypothetical protein
MRVLAPILSNIFLFAAALGFGSLLRRLIPQTFSSLDRFALILLGGFGLLGISLFCAGQFWFTRTAIVLILLLGVLLALRDSAPRIAVWRASLSGFSLPPIPVAIVAAMLVITAIGGLAEPTGDMNNDSIAYHYLGPKVWLRTHLIRPVPDEILTTFPVLIESQYAALMSLGGQRAPELFAVLSVASLLLIAASLAIRLGAGPSGAWWATALIATMPAIYRGAYDGFIDALFAAFLLAAARIGFDAETPAHYALFGIFCGIAMGTKYTAIPSFVLLLLCAFLVAVWSHRSAWPALLTRIGTSCTIALVVASPFYLRNFILFGCPIYPPPPILFRFFHVRDVLPAVMHELETNVRDTGIGMGRRLSNFLLLPFNLTYHTANFRGAGGIGLVPLALSPIGAILSRLNPFANGLLLFAVLQLAVWFATAQVSRYLISVYVIAALFGVLGWQFVSRSASSLARLLAGLVVAVSILYGFFMILPDRRDDLHAALSPAFELQRRHQEIPFLESLDFINSHPAVTQVLILDPYFAAYYSNKPYLKPFGRWGEQTLPTETAADATATTASNVVSGDKNSAAAKSSAILAQLPHLHVSHILDVTYQPGGPFLLPEHTPHLTLVFQRETQRIYRVDE